MASRCPATVCMQTVRGAASGAFDRKTIPRIVFRTCLTAPERHSDRSNAEVQAHHRPLPGRRLQSNRPRGGDQLFNIAPNLLQQDFTASGPNQNALSWFACKPLSGDRQATSPMSGRAKYEPGQKTIWGIVFPAIGVYLAVILDLFSRRVVGWAISSRIKQDLALRALNMAIALRRPPPGCIHHSDRGSQYCARDYQKLLRKPGLTPSPLADVNIRCRAADEREGQLLR